MMEECIKWAKENDVEQLELEVVSENKGAKVLYEKLGFEVYGTEPRSLKYSDGTYVDQYFMCKFLK